MLERILKLDHLTFGQRLADRLCGLCGGWPFILIQLGFYAGWMAWNSAALGRVHQHRTFDPYPWILLNLILSFTAGIENPIILMAQNRQAQRDRVAAEVDYGINRENGARLDHLVAHLQEQDAAMDRLRAAIAALDGRPKDPV